MDTAGWSADGRRSRPGLEKDYRMVVGQAPCRLGVRMERESVVFYGAS
jgi:hypothetical protein